MVSFMRKLIEWDRRRRFGHTFEDFLLLLFLSATASVLAFCFLIGISRWAVIFVALIAYLVLVNRRGPDL